VAVLEDPEVIRQARAATRKRRFLWWGIPLYYTVVCVSSGVFMSFVYHLSERVNEGFKYYKSIHPTLTDFLATNLQLFVLFLVPIFMLFMFSWIPLRGLRPLSDYAASAPIQVSRLTSSIEAVSLATGRPLLPCLVMTSSMPNAFSATIRGGPKLVVTSGFLSSDLTQSEMIAVVAHESAHIETGSAFKWRGPSRFFFLLVGMVLITIWWGTSINDYLSRNFTYNSSAFMPLFTILVLLPIPVAVYLGVHLDRQDDIFADATAAMITRDPEALISAIEKIAASKGAIDYSLFGITAIVPRPEEQRTLSMRALKYLFVNPLERGTGPELDRRWMVSVHRYFHDNLTVITRPRRKDREKLRAEPGERGGTIHERLAALREILDGGCYLEAQTLKIPADTWE
jgi:heat shock protein HtpX